MRMLIGLVLAAGLQAQQNGYVGSLACAGCHVDTYERWAKTRMANVVVDPRLRPEAIIPDLSRPNPLVTFTRDQIAFTYGSKWKQRYFQKIGDDFFPLPAQWDVINQVWRAYNTRPGTDWWTAHYGPANTDRPTGPLCDGCHSVNYDLKTKQPSEWNVGCEKCHGPGANHVAQPTAANVVNPARLDSFRENDVCIQCHSQGQPKTNPMEGRYFDWPVGFVVGAKLEDYWTLEEHKLGENTFTHFPDGTGHKNRMQGNDFVQSAMYLKGVRCSNCHDVHGTNNDADLRVAGNAVCLQCHGERSPLGPRAETMEQHTHHRAGSAGGQCVACHMPKIEQTIADINVRSHTFRFVSPAHGTANGMPNSCNLCHTDKDAAWATEALKGWKEFSAWRVGN